MSYRKLMVIVSDYLSIIVKKGEVVERYYNPGEYFNEVHIVMINDDYISPESKTFFEIQKMVGSAKMFLYNLPKPNFFRSGAWSKFGMKKWYQSGIVLAKKILPDVVRTYNNYMDGELAYQIKCKLKIPYIVSLHGVWDSDCLISCKERVFKFFIEKFERRSLMNADYIIAVYKPAYEYAKKYGGEKVELLYNRVANNKIKLKTNYQNENCLQIITINRQIRDKNPENILRAIKNINCHYTLIGDGALHDKLVALSERLGCSSKVTFIRNMPNDMLCRKLSEYDILVIHCDYLGITKGTIEASWAGIPIIVNRHASGYMKDFEGDWALICENTPESYNSAIMKLVESKKLREVNGSKAYNHAKEHFNAEKIEERTVEIYQSVVDNKMKA